MNDRENDREIEPVEAGLLDAIDEAAPGSREVYADWLEERGELPRAELLRVLELLVAMPRAPSFDAAFEQLTERLVVVARDIDLAWRQRVGRTAIASCLPYADLTQAIEARPARRAAGSWQLPEQLRYLEELAPAPVAAHEPMSPGLQAMLEQLASNATSRVLERLLASLRARSKTA
ncbi:MAG TPA: hypothetical protein VH165_30150 [Kofleriaceae bacterium]|nr:hypothetical protein [Kofleriaceae bacterium]